MTFVTEISETTAKSASQTERAKGWKGCRVDSWSSANHL